MNLRWTDNKIGRDGVRILAEALKTNITLTELDLSSAVKMAIIINNDIMSITTTRTENDIGREGVRMLSEVLKVDSGIFSRFRGLKSNTTLTSLNLSGGGMKT